MSPRPDGQGGLALPMALVVLLAAGFVTATLVDLVRSELVVAQARRTAAIGLATVDACLARACAALPAGYDQAAALAGPDGTSGTADDGVLPVPAGCTAVLRAGPLGALRPFLDVDAAIASGGRGVRAIVGAPSAPTPAVVWATDGATLGGVPGRLTLDGIDPARADLAPLAALGAPADPSALDAWLASASVAVAPGTGAPIHAAAAPLAAVAARLAALGAAPAFAPTPTPPAPALYAVSGDLVLGTAGVGTGLLFIERRLDIEADFAFNGLVVAAGGVRVARGVVLRVDGALWLGGDPMLDVEGDATIRLDRAALDVAGGLAPLPRPATIVGLMDR
jgi:hypothetical protein